MVVTGDLLRQQAIKYDVTHWIIHSCSLCGVPVGYFFESDKSGVWFDGSCNCSSVFGPQVRSWDEIAGHFNLQRHPDVIKKYQEFWHLNDNNEGQ